MTTEEPLGGKTKEKYKSSYRMGESERKRVYMTAYISAACDGITNYLSWVLP
jgi:hypothetical protein